MKAVYSKLTLIQSALKAPKSQRNNFGKYNYRSLEDIFEGVKPHLLTHNCSVTVSDEIEFIGNNIYVKATVTFTENETGEQIVATA